MSCCLPSQITKSLKRLYFDASRTGDLQSCLSPEIQVLVACARTSPIPWRIQQLLTVDLDWQRILDLAIDYELASLLYSSVALRPMVDLDLLVRATDLDRADDNLRRLGYVVDESYQSQEWYKERHHHLAPYMAPDRFLTVELHHHVVS